MEGFWGKKIGMTQVFSNENKVIPVTAIDTSNWYITQIKTDDKDGYNSVKLGHLKAKYKDQTFSDQWLKDPKKYFSAFKEVKLDLSLDNKFNIGQAINISEIIKDDSVLDVFGITKGAGFQGVVKRHNFAGGRDSHGAVFGRFTGSLSHMRSRGRVIKGKKMPGHMGLDKRVMKNLKVIKIEADSNLILVKGSVPGKSGSLVYCRKSKHG